MTPSIGRPIANTKVYLLDGHCQLLPIGIVGELHIGGDCLARGYLSRPELTAEKFIQDPFSEDVGARLYKTGDLARYLSDGNIEFLGRIDFQVKIRGFRIELGEVEVALVRHPDVKEAVVTAVEDRPGEKRLIAYVVVNVGHGLSTSGLRQFLKLKLPEYMVPSAVVILEALPLNSNGKIDRKALSIPDRIRPELDNAFVAPRTAVEETLASIWRDVLGLEQVGVNDNFFDLGGHSLMATQVVSRIYDAFQIEVPLRVMFDTLTLADLANLVTQEYSSS